MVAARPVVILGPTAGGKTLLAASLAQRLGAGRAEVLSADSMQVYRELDAGTAKPPPALRRRVVHHLIDIVAPTERFTVADWLERADALVEDLCRRGVVPIVVGGTHLYVRALLEGLFGGPPADPKRRAALAAVPPAALHERLRAVDPAAAARIHPHDQRRLVRALEVYESTGRPISAWQTQWATVPTAYRHDPVLLGLAWSAPALNRRINLRVKAMFYPAEVEAGLAAEVLPAGEPLPAEAQRLEAAGRLGPQARQALGYKQVIECLAAGRPLREAFEQTKIHTRRFARMQRTWLRRFAPVHWLAAERLGAEELAEAAIAIISR